jgi:hypothetical protein
MWIAFGLLQRKRLPAIFGRYWVCISMENPLFMELTNESLMEFLVKQMYTTEFKHQQPTLDSHLSKDIF